MNTQDIQQGNAGGLVTITEKGLNVVATLDGLLTVRGSEGVYKCSDCGHEAHYPEVDLWTRCGACLSNLVTDDDVTSLDDIDPI